MVLLGPVESLLEPRDRVRGNLRAGGRGRQWTPPPFPLPEAELILSHKTGQEGRRGGGNGRGRGGAAMDTTWAAREMAGVTLWDRRCVSSLIRITAHLAARA